MKELQLLKWLIENPQWIPTTHENIWETAPHTKIYHVIKMINGKGNPISIQALQHILRDKQDLINELDLMSQAQSIDKATALIISDELRINARTRLLQDLQHIDLADEKLYAASLKKINELEYSNPPKELQKPVNFKDWSKHIAPDSIVIPSGFPFLKDTGTDTKVGDLVNFLAASGNFKTGAMTHIVKHQVYNGKNVLFFSMEESAQNFIARVGQGILETETVWSYEQLTPRDIANKFIDKELGELDVISGEMVIVEELEEKILELEESNGYKYDFIIIDYSAQITSSKLGKNTQEHQMIAEIFRNLKVLALGHDKIVVTAIQSNRDGYGKKKTPDVENTASSMGGVHAADLMMSCKYAANPNGIKRDTPQDEKHTDIKGFVKLKVIKKRTGTISVGESFYFEHRANGNMLATTEGDEFSEQYWDNVFDPTNDNPNRL